jgi:hypothetical protein
MVLSFGCLAKRYGHYNAGMYVSNAATEFLYAKLPKRLRMHAYHPAKTERPGRVEKISSEMQMFLLCYTVIAFGP